MIVDIGRNDEIYSSHFSQGDFMSTASSIRDQIEQAILAGELGAGQRVYENALATKHGVSRSVVREALRSLENEGLVTFLENRGAVVRQPTVSDILELYDVRAGLSATAGRLAASNASTAQIEELREYQSQMTKLRDLDSEAEYDRLNIAFHDLIFIASGNQRLKQIHDAVSKEMRLFVRRGVASSGGLRMSCFEHERILQALMAGDVVEAGNSFEAHIYSGKARMMQKMYSAQDPAFA